MPVYSVSDLTGYLRGILERDALLQDLWVGGEVANLARPASGHSYFTLRDAAASLRAVMFKSAYGAELLSNGEAVVTHGHVSMYEVRGEVQLVVDFVQPEGVGELQLRLEELRLRLEAEGLFEPSRKRPLPEFPQRVGVVTSPSGAVWRDIQNVAARRYPLVELVLAPTAVQGDAAVAGIVEAMDALNRLEDIDIVIVARGGGSLEDLWPFNEEAVARAVYASRSPVISGVGHETDFTITDMVADHRAPTPSAAAEMAVPDRLELASRLLDFEQDLTAGVFGHLRSKRDSLPQLLPRLRRSRPDLDSLRIRIDDLLAGAAKSLSRLARPGAERVEGMRMRLESLSPQGTLRRGYAIVQTAACPAAVVDAARLKAGEEVLVTLARGGFEAEVTSTHGAGGKPPLDVTEITAPEQPAKTQPGG